MSKYKEITTREVLSVCRGELICGDKETIFDNFCSDTRQIKPGDVFIGAKGEHTNGSEFYEEALKKGAKACILQDVIITDNVKERYKDATIVKVDNVITAVQKLASFKRNLYDIPVVAVTGSNGKTSTKDIIASVMSQAFNVLKTEGNFNSQLGLPLTILRLKDHNAMVVEMGMSQLNEISRLTNIAKPTIAVITNVGTAHIGFLGSRDNILKAKLEIMEGLQNDGKVIINNDNDMLHEWYMKSSSHHQYDVITYGLENVSNIMAYNSKTSEKGSTYDIDLSGETYHVNVGVGGEHFISNSLCAIAVGRTLGIPMKNILNGVSHFELTKRRMQVEKLQNNVIVINDCYNANYDSMKAAIDYLGKLQINRRIAVLGDMAELGEYSEEFHRKVGEEVAKNDIDLLVTVGELSEYIAEEANKQGMLRENIYVCHNLEEAKVTLKNLIISNTAILLKASNSMNFQDIFNNLMEKEVE